MIHKSIITATILSFTVFFVACSEQPGKSANTNTVELNASGLSDVQKLYKTNCAICHGMDGKKGFSGAKKFSESKMSVEERIEIITNGKNAMVPYKGVLNDDEIKLLAEYTLTLK